MDTHPLSSKKTARAALILPILAGFFVFAPCSEASHSASLVISEIQIEGDKSDEEFIRLYNNSSETIDLTGFALKKKTKSGTESTLITSAKFSGTIPSHQSFTISHPDFEEHFNADLVYSGATYYISADNTILLFDADKNLLDKVGYGSAGDYEEAPAPQPPKNKSLQRRIKDGLAIDTDNNKDDFHIPADPPKPKQEYSDEIRLNEILPNPKGADGGNEFIELYNFGSEDIELGNWILRDNSTTKYTFPPTTIKSKQFLTILQSVFKFTLNNSDETITLFNPDEDIVSQISYQSSKDNISLNWTPAEQWEWSRFPTPDAENKLNLHSEIEIKLSKKIYVNAYAEFEAKVKNPDEDELKYTWEFGDDRKSYIQKTKHKYQDTGPHNLKLSVFDGSETISKELAILVEKMSHPKVRIVALMPNPKGKDTENEWIEIKNDSKKKIDLENWSIKTGWKKLTNHPIRKRIIIEPGKTKKITRKHSAFSLNNEKSEVEICYPDGKTAHDVKYKKKDAKIKDDETYEKTKDGWKWTNSKANLAVIEKEPIAISEEIPVPEPEITDLDQAEVVLGAEDDTISETALDEKDDSAILQSLLELPSISKFILESGFDKKKAINIEVVVIDGEEFYLFSQQKTAQEHYAIKFAKEEMRELNRIINRLLIRESH